MDNFKKILQGLFSNKLLLVKQSGDRLKLIDFAQQQSIGSENSRYKLMRRSANNSSGWGSYTNNIESIELNRVNSYMEYELMDTDAILSAALDVYADECLVGETKIPLLNGESKTIKELFENKAKDFWVYGLDEKTNFKPVQCKQVVFKGIKPIMQITLDDGTVIKATPDHKFFRPDGSQVLMKDLGLGDSLLAHRTKYSDSKLVSGYHMIKDSSGWNYTHRRIKKSISLKSTNSLEKDKVTHHVDFNKLNNCPDNLLIMGRREHFRYHCDNNHLMWERRNNDIKQLATNNNHKIINIIHSEPEEVYDLVNTGDMHAFAIESNDKSLIYSHNCTSLGPTGDLLTITTENPKLKKVLTNLFYDVLNLEYNLWYWVRSLVKNGDHFLVLNIQENAGVVEVMPLHPSLIRRVEADDDVYFAFQGSGTGYVNFDKNRFELFEVAHFRLLSDSMYLPYGKSMVEGAKKEYKKLTLMEDAMLIHRIMRAPSKRIFKIDVGNINTDEVDNHMEEIMSQNKKVPYIDPMTGQYNLEYNIQNLNEDYYLPIRGDRSGTTIETLDGLGNDGSIEDIEYIRKKMMQNLKIPFAYLGEEDGAEGKSLLAAEDVRFARTIERIQKVIVGELYKIAYAHLMSQGFNNAELLEFELKLHNPSLIYERQKIELLNEKVTLIGNLKETNLFSRRYIYENIFNLSPEEWKAMEQEVITDLKRGFREKQITEEGNDPEVTGKSFGTPHDLAAMYVDQNMKNASDKASAETTIKQLYTPDDRLNNDGRPPEANKFGSIKDKDNGRDPFGSKELTASLESFNKNFAVKKTIITETKEPLNESINMLDDTSVDTMENIFNLTERN